MALKYYLLSLATAGMAIFLLIHFALLYLDGVVKIYEYSQTITTIEFTLTTLILLLAVYCLSPVLKRILARNKRP